MGRLRIETERYLFPCIAALTGVGLVFELTGYFYPNWYLIAFSSTRYTTIGLFISRTCKADTCFNRWFGNSEDIWIKGSSLYYNRWLQTFSLCFGVIGFIASISQLVNRGNSQSKKNISHGVYFIFTLVAGFLAVVGVLLFRHEAEGENGWCYIFSLLAACMWFLASLTSCVWCREQQNNYDERLLSRFFTSTRF